MTQPSTTRRRDRVAQAEPVLKAAEMALRYISVPARHRALQSARRGRTTLHRAWRYVLLRSVAKSCGTVVDVRADVFICRPERLSLGSRISIHPSCYIDASGGIDVGDNVSIAPGASILSTEHELERVYMPIRDQFVSSARVSIGDDVQIGAGARVLAGVTIGSGAIVGAGAIVTHDVKPSSIVGGRPLAGFQGAASLTAAHQRSVAMFSDARIGTNLDGRIASNNHAVAGDRWLRGLRGDDYVRLHVRVDLNPGSGTNGLDGNVVALPYYIGLASFVRHAPSLLRAIRSAVSSADVVVTRLPGLIGLCASTIALMYSKPLATELVGDPYESLVATAPSNRRLMGSVGGAMTRGVVRRARVIRYVTQRQLQELYPPGPHTTTIAASDVDLSPWLVEQVVPENPDPTVIAVGSQEQLYKGHADLISAIAIMRNMGVRSSLVLVGHGKYHELLRRCVSEADLDEQVHFVGYVDDVVRLRCLVDQSWLYAMPSHTEGLPRSLVEAMARGKACVGSDVGGIRELLPPAYRVPPRNPEMLAAVLSRVLCDPSERQQAGSLNAVTARDCASKAATQGPAWADAVDRLRGITHA